MIYLNLCVAEILLSLLAKCVLHMAPARHAVYIRVVLFSYMAVANKIKK